MRTVDLQRWPLVCIEHITISLYDTAASLLCIRMLKISDTTTMTHLSNVLGPAVTRASRTTSTTDGGSTPAARQVLFVVIPHVAVQRQQTDPQGIGGSWLRAHPAAHQLREVGGHGQVAVAAQQLQVVAVQGGDALLRHADAVLGHLGPRGGGRRRRGRAAPPRWRGARGSSGDGRWAAGLAGGLLL